MKWLIVGNGIQGKKRKANLGLDCVGILDPYSNDSDFKALDDIAVHYDVVAICTSQNAKLQYLRHFAERGIPCLVEKPFPNLSDEEFDQLQRICVAKNTFIYTALNHRFEPSIVELRQLIIDGAVGNPYHVQMRYGNGTVLDVMSSPWKNTKDGLLYDLGSHLFDLYYFVFGNFSENLNIERIEKHESTFPDYIRISGRNLSVELGYIFWKSDFRFEIWGSKGSVHAIGLKKWGNSQLILRQRKLPSGVPEEKVTNFAGIDSTWSAEHRHMEGLCRAKSVGINADVHQLNKILYRMCDAI